MNQFQMNHQTQAFNNYSEHSTFYSESNNQYSYPLNQQYYDPQYSQMYQQSIPTSQYYQPAPTVAPIPAPPQPQQQNGTEEVTRKCKHNQVEHRRRERIKREIEKIRIVLGLDNSKISNGEVLETAFSFISQVCVFKSILMRCITDRASNVDDENIHGSDDATFENAYTEAMDLIPSTCTMFECTPDIIKMEREALKRKRPIEVPRNRDQKRKKILPEVQNQW